MIFMKLYYLIDHIFDLCLGRVQPSEAHGSAKLGSDDSTYDMVKVIEGRGRERVESPQTMCSLFHIIYFKRDDLPSLS